MNSKTKKRIVQNFRYVYKVGFLKSIFIYISMAASGAEFEVKWKNRHIHFRKHTSDFYVFQQIFALGQYDINLLGKVKNVKTIVDLGANIGLSALKFKQKYPNATLIAVEPEINNFEMLVKNTAGLSGIQCLNYAIWCTNKNLVLLDTGRGEYGFAVHESSTDEVASVAAITLPEIIDRFQLDKIDILKIDIEGSEIELFDGDCEEWLSKVRCIVIELHDWFRPGCAASFFRALRHYDYTLSVKGENFTVVFAERQIKKDVRFIA